MQRVEEETRTGVAEVIGELADSRVEEELGEMAPVFERRLADSDHGGWSGSIAVRGDRHQAVLRLADGGAAAGPAGEGTADAALSATDDTATRVVSGCRTPYEGYLDRERDVSSGVAGRIAGLLETLFPRRAD